MTILTQIQNVTMWIVSCVFLILLYAIQTLISSEWFRKVKDYDGGVGAIQCGSY
jgi:hypothetical protein